MKGIKKIGKRNLLSIFLVTLIILAVGFSLIIILHLVRSPPVFSRFLFVPAPGPYPGIKVKAEYSSSICNVVREDSKTFTYDIDLSQKVLQTYYDRQMAKFCKGKWSWIDLIDIKINTAGCDLNNQQIFRVDLFTQTQQKVRIIQTQSIYVRGSEFPDGCTD
jgi:hypothetical protein